MATVLDELVVQTKVDLSGLQSGLRQAETLAAQAKGKLAQELGAATFVVNTTEAVSQLQSLSAVTNQLHASLIQLRAQLAQPFKVTVDTSDLKRATADMAGMQAAMAGAARASTGAGRTRSAAASPAATTEDFRQAATEDIRQAFARGAAVSAPIVVNGSLVVAGGTLPSAWLRGPTEGFPPVTVVSSGPATLAGFGGGFGGIPPRQLSGVSGEQAALPGRGSFPPLPPGRAASLLLDGPDGSTEMFRDARGAWTTAADAARQFGGATRTAAAQTETFSQAAQQARGAAQAWGTQFRPPQNWGSQFVPPGQAAQLQMRDIPAQMQKADPSMFDGMAGKFAQGLAFATAFGTVYSTIGKIKDEWASITEGAKEFSSAMEISQASLASLLVSGRDYRTTSGQTVSTAQAFKAALSEALPLQEKLYDLDQKTLGTGRDLIQVYQQVLAHTRGQTVTDAQRLQLTQAILNASVIAGNREGLHGLEARQTLEPGPSQNALIRQKELITNDELRKWREADQLVPKLIERLQVYNVMGEQVGATNQGLASTFESLKDRIMGVQFGENFAAGKTILAATNEEFRRMREHGDILPALFGGSKAELEQFGVNLAHAAVNISKFIAEASNGWLLWHTRFVNWLADENSLLNKFLASYDRFSGLVNRAKAHTEQSGMAASPFFGPPSTPEERERQMRQGNPLVVGGLLGMAPKDLVKEPVLTHTDKPKSDEDDAAAKRKAEALKRARESADAQAAQAELALAQRRASITGDSTKMQAAAEKKLAQERDAALGHAKDDPEQRLAIWREYYAKKAALDLDATQREITNARRVSQQNEQDAQKSLRAINEQGRAQEALLGAQLSGTRRNIGIAQSRGAGPEILNPLFNQERSQIGQIQQGELTRATEAGALAAQHIAQIRGEIAGYQQKIALAGQDQVKIRQYKDEIERLSPALTQWESTGVTAATAIITANEKAAGSVAQVNESQRQLNLTVAQRIQQGLARDAQDSSQRFADAWLRGIHGVSGALADMVTKGKFDLQSLNQVAAQVITDINREMIEGQIRQMLGIQGGNRGTQQYMSEGGAMGIFGQLLGLGRKQGPGMNVPGVPNTYNPGNASQVQWQQVAVSGIQQIAQTGATATQQLTQASGNSFSFLSTLASSILASIQAAAAGAGAGAGGGGILGGLFGGLGGLFGGGGGGGAAAGWTSGWTSGFNVPFLENGGIVPHFADGGFAGGAMPAVVHRGEMILSAGETHNLMRYGSAKLPGGAGTVRTGTSGGVNVTMHVHGVQDVNGFQRSRSQIAARTAREIQIANHRNN